MFRNNISNVLLILILFFAISCVSQNGYQFSSRYSPIYNPDGDAFDSNAEFAHAYSIYKNRRDALAAAVVNKDNKDKSNVEHQVKRKVQIKNIDQLVKEALFQTKDSDLMIDSNGVNLVEVVGAKFIDPKDVNDVYDDSDRYNSSKNGEVDSKKESKIEAKSKDEPSNVDSKRLEADSNNVSGIKKNEDKTKSYDIKDKKLEVNDNKFPIVTKGEDKPKSHDIKDKKLEVSDDKFPIITKGEDKTKSSGVKDKELEVSDNKVPVITKDEDAPKSSDVKDKKLEVNDNKFPIITKGKDKTKSSGVKDKKLEVSDNKVPIITKNEDEPKSSDVKDKKLEVNDNKVPVITKGEDKPKSHDVKDKKLEVSDNKVPVITKGEDNNYQDVEDSKNKSKNEELVTKHHEGGLRSLLKFSKDDDKKDNLNNPILVKREPDMEQLHKHNSEDKENDKRKSNKSTHFLSFLKESEDVKKEQLKENNNEDQVVGNTSPLNVKNHANVTNDMQEITIDHNDQNKQVEISEEEDNLSMTPMQQFENIKNHYGDDEEDYTISYYYVYENTK